MVGEKHMNFKQTISAEPHLARELAMREKKFRSNDSAAILKYSDRPTKNPFSYENPRQERIFCTKRVEPKVPEGKIHLDVSLSKKNINKILTGSRICSTWNLSAGKNRSD